MSTKYVSIFAQKKTIQGIEMSAWTFEITMTAKRDDGSIQRHGAVLKKQMSVL